MNQILSLGLESKLPKVGRIHYFPANSKVHVRIPDFMLNAVEFIGKYNGFAEEESYQTAIMEARDFLMQVDLDDNLEGFRRNFKIDWVYHPYRMGRVKTYQAIFQLENPFIYNLLLSEFDIPKKKVFNYLSGLYVQLFLNEYNETPNLDYRLIFPTREEAIANARNNKNFPLLRALNQFKQIKGFTRYDIITE